MQRNDLSQTERRIFGLHDYSTTLLEDEDVEQLYGSPVDDERIRNDDIDDVLRDFVSYDGEDD